MAAAAGPERTEIRETFFPAEWYPQSGVQLTWPHAATDWAPILADIDETYVRMALEVLAGNEHLLIVTPEPERIRAIVHERIPTRFTPHIRYFRCPTNDTWARDHAFLTVVTTGGPRLMDYRFNGWGMKFAADSDNLICRRMAGVADTAGSTTDAGGGSDTDADATPPLRGLYSGQQDLVLEGGSVESDGCGTLLTTEACLLSPNRNPHLTRHDIEARLKRDLCADRVLWLTHGHLIGDDTDSHIDTLARFCSTTAIAYVAPPADTADPHHDDLAAMQDELRGLRTATGKPYDLIPLPMPDPVCDPDDGHRLPATYANFLILNKAVLMPTYAQPDNDALAHRRLAQAFPRKAIIDIDARTLVRQHGSIHCSAMQFPVGVMA
ncbi:MAG: agmatine deiminase family protein [Bacteroidaceae bacterium]|nr:agmatine deiminase family protein [Bacteroidaceae bacterium]